MKSGKVIQTFRAKDGREVVLRTLRCEDLDDLLRMINSLVEERANIAVDKKFSRGEEIDWLSRALSRQERDEVFYLVAEVDGRAVANSELNQRLSAYDKHVGIIGIAIEDGFRDLGIGTEMMRALVGQAKSIDLRVITLGVFANTTRAIHLYEKVGFVQTGTIPNRFFKEGKYVDEIIMTKTLG